MVTAIKCEEVLRQISNYLEGDLSPELKARMDEHFRDCRNCSAVLDGAGNIVHLVGDDRAFDVPRGFGSRLFRKFEAHLRAESPIDENAQVEIPLGITEESIVVGSHLVYFWENDLQFKQGVKFLEPGLRGDDFCVLFGNDSTNERVLAVLRQGGIPVEEMLKEERLVVLGRRAPAPVILSDIVAIFHAAIRRGARAIRFLGTLVAGSEKWPGGEDDVLQLEAKVSAAVAQFPAVVLCMYDVASLSGRVMLKGGFQTHPLVASNEGLRANPCYVPEEQFLGGLGHVH